MAIFKVITTKPCGCLMFRDSREVVAECEKHANKDTNAPINRARESSS
jgi:hypothetical protein